RCAMRKSESYANAAAKLLAEAKRATDLHPMPQFSLHEAYGVIAEEFREFELEVFKKRPRAEDIEKELVQLGAMCIRAIAELGPFGYRRIATPELIAILSPFEAEDSPRRDTVA